MIGLNRLARSSRKKKHREAYNESKLKFTDFHDLKALSEILIRNKTKNTEGHTGIRLLIKGLRYSKKNLGIIEYKYMHDVPYKCINVFGRRKNISEASKKALQQTIGHKCENEQDLKLCRNESTPVEFHEWYQSLPTSKDALDLSTLVTPIMNYHQYT